MSDLLHQQMIPTLPEIAANYQRSIRDRTMSVCLSPEWGGGAIGRAGREASESIGLCQQDCELLYVRLASYSIPPYQRQTESSRMQESKKVARSPSSHRTWAACRVAGLSSGKHTHKQTGRLIWTLKLVHGYNQFECPTEPACLFVCMFSTG